MITQEFAREITELEEEKDETNRLKDSENQYIQDFTTNCQRYLQYIN